MDVFRLFDYYTSTAEWPTKYRNFCCYNLWIINKQINLLLFGKRHVLRLRCCVVGLFFDRFDQFAKSTCVQHLPCVFNKFEFDILIFTSRSMLHDRLVRRTRSIESAILINNINTLQDTSMLCFGQQLRMFLQNLQSID